MKIVSLVGLSNSGKTTTLNLFIKKLLSSGGEIVDERTSLKGNSTMDYLDDNLNPNDENHYAVIKIEGHIIGITTYGDTEWHLIAAFDNFKDCELCVCASKSRGNTRTFLNNLPDADAIIRYWQPRVECWSIGLESRYNQANESMLNLLMNESRSLLKGSPYKFN